MKYNGTSSNSLGYIEQALNSRVNHMTFICDLESSLCSHVIGSAHYLTPRNICVKFNEHPLKGS